MEEDTEKLDLKTRVTIVIDPDKNENMVVPHDQTPKNKPPRTRTTSTRSTKSAQSASFRSTNGSLDQTNDMMEQLELPFINIKPPKTYDEVDALPESLRYNWFDLFCTMVSMTTYIADVVMDCIVAYYFYHLAVDHGIYHYWYFGLTITFILIPSLLMMGFSFRWYLIDEENPHLPRRSMCRWVLRLCVLLLQLAPLLRYAESIQYGIMSRVAKYREENTTDPAKKVFYKRERIKYYTLMVYEDADATLLRLYESFMESAPQLVIQIYILINDPHANRINDAKIMNEKVDPVLKLTILALSVASSLVSLAWSLVVYHRSLRYTYQNKKNIGTLGTIFQFLWNFTWITGRVLALSLFASIFPKWIGPFCFAHWVVMTSWVVYQRTQACNTKCEEFLFALVLGAIYIFSFFNAKEERTRYKYLFYYCFSFIENSALVSVWFWKASPDLWYRIPAIACHYLAFFSSIFFMIIYYLFFHPTGIDVSFITFLKKPKAPPSSDIVISLSNDRASTPLSRLSASNPELDKEAGDPLSRDTTDFQRVRRANSCRARYAPDLSSATPRRLKYMGYKVQDFEMS